MKSMGEEADGEGDGKIKEAMEGMGNGKGLEVRGPRVR